MFNGPIGLGNSPEDLLKLIFGEEVFEKAKARAEEEAEKEAEIFKKRPKYMATCPVCGYVDSYVKSKAQESGINVGHAQCDECGVHILLTFKEDTKTFDARYVTRTEFEKISEESNRQHREKILALKK